MRPNLKEKIILTAILLFMKNGYENTTMRQIAKELDLAVGNVNYYFPKKEEIVKEYHNNVVESFLEKVIEKSFHKNPWITFFACESSFMAYIATNSYVKELYASFTKVPALRDFYVQRHIELFKSIFYEQLPANDENIQKAVLAGSTLEFEMISRYDFTNESLEELLIKVFKVQLLFLNLDVDEYKNEIEKGIKEGKSYLETLNVPINETVFLRSSKFNKE
ncbi:MAG: TetR/AcrR family transcriptional regulator [Holdemanella sp.]|nr:TetR/AcrR family transcriptional regulator [Holdemanella sp.]